MKIEVEIVTKQMEMDVETFQPMASLLINLKLPLEPLQDSVTDEKLDGIAHELGKAIIEEMIKVQNN